MIQFFRDILSGKENTPGSKRFTSIWTLLLFTIEVLYHLITHVNVQPEIIYCSVALILTPLGLNAVTAIKAISAKSQVATEMVKNDPVDESTADSAKEVINSNKTE